MYVNAKFTAMWSLLEEELMRLGGLPSMKPKELISLSHIIGNRKYWETLGSTISESHATQ